jgi:hypothetical protein
MSTIRPFKKEDAVRFEFVHDGVIVTYSDGKSFHYSSLNAIEL